MVRQSGEMHRARTFVGRGGQPSAALLRGQRAKAIAHMEKAEAPMVDSVQQQSGRLAWSLISMPCLVNSDIAIADVPADCAISD